MSMNQPNEINHLVGTESGGQGGIRTPGTRKRPTVFKTAAFDHSATCPIRHRFLALTTGKNKPSLLQELREIGRSFLVNGLVGNMNETCCDFLIQKG